MLLLGCRAPIYGRITLWKFLCQTTVPEQLNKVPLNLKLQKKKLNKMLLQGSWTPTKGCDHTLKISMSNHSTWTTEYCSIKSKIKKKKKIK